MFYIILGFVGIFIVFIAVIMNYAAAYRTNNYVVTIIEQTEGSYNFGTSSDTSRNTLVGYLKDNNYYNGLRVTCTNNANGAVFNVQTYINFYIPLLEVGFPIKITNDTKTIYGVFCEDESVSSNGCWKALNGQEC